MRSAVFVCVLWLFGMSTTLPASEIRFQTDFPGGSLGRVESLGEKTFRCHVKGEANESGRNRQASWYYFRIDGAKNSEITLVLTDFVGEYNLRPGACPMNEKLRPVFSTDGRKWRHFETMQWDKEKKEATLRFPVESDSFWIAHVPPYTPERLAIFLREIDQSPYARIETYGRSVGEWPLQKVCVTDESVSNEEKLHLWFVARQHAWEAPTTKVVEGLLRFLIGSTDEAAALRRRAVVHVVPMFDPDGCQRGGVRYNANGYDTNRHWPRVNLRSKSDLVKMPEIWYAKKAMTAAHREQPIDLLIALHNQEIGDCIFAGAPENGPLMRKIVRFESELKSGTFYESVPEPGKPARPIRFTATGSETIESLWSECGIPVALVELQVAPNPKLGRIATPEDYRRFGEGLLRAAVRAGGDGAAAFHLRTADVPYKPYVDVLLTPESRNVLRDGPSDHLHHHGLMFAVAVDGINFWEEVAGHGKQIERSHHRETDAVESLELDWIGPDGKVLVQEKRRVTECLLSGQSVTLVDWQSRLSLPAEREKAVLGGSHYAGLGMRFQESMDKDGRFFADAASQDDESVRGSERLRRCRWMAYTAKLEGRPVTVSLLSAPGNPRPMDAFTMGGDGKAFAYLSATSNLHREPLELQAGQSFLFHYAVAVWEGERSVDEVEAVFKAWAEQPQNDH